MSSRYMLYLSDGTPRRCPLGGHRMRVSPFSHQKFVSQGPTVCVNFVWSFKGATGTVDLRLAYN